MPRTWDRSRFAPWLLRALGQVNEEPTSRLCRRTSELSRAAKRRRLQRRVRRKVGGTLVLEGHSRMNRAIVQVAGDAWRLSGTALHAEGQPGGVVHLALLRYTQAL